MTDVYITDIASFLPNDPISNDDIEKVLGMVNDKPSRSRRIVLRSNGIKTRFYAIDPSTGEFTHNSAQMAAEAIRALVARSDISLDELDCLCCGTSSPDQIKPAHGPMVHGELGSAPCEVVSTAGVCTSSVTAMKYAYMEIASGMAQQAISSGSEFASSFMRAQQFEPEVDARVQALEKQPELAFEKDFLRWMLSDGAGAALLRTTPNSGRPSLRIDWIECKSFAGSMPACMYSGAIKDENGRMHGWREAANPQDVMRQSYFAVKQDARLLNDTIMPISVHDALLPMAAKHGLKPEDVTWFLPHYSSEYFRSRLYEQMIEQNFAIPYERWFTNLQRVGNVGSASIYLIMEELLYSGKLKKGDRLLCYIPESARFSICYMLLTVV